MHVTLEGTDQVVQRFDGMITRCERPQTILEFAARTLGTSFAQNFSAAGRPDRWPPRALSDKHTHPLLNKTGHMINAATSVNNGSSSISRIELNSTQSSLFFGLAVPYAIYHHFGGIHLPKRNFILFQSEDVQSIIDFASETIWKGL